MGIEPTGDKVDSPPTGFEDRGRHQAYRHFPFALVHAQGKGIRPLWRTLLL